MSWRLACSEPTLTRTTSAVDRALGALSGLQKVLAFASSKTQGPACP
jgi:hypothetical protein